MMRISIVIFVITLTCLFSCTFESPEAREICYLYEVKPIIISNCTESGCHNSIDKKGDFDFTNDEGILSATISGKHAISKLYSVLSNPLKPMPPSKEDELSEEFKTTIAGWIEQGAKINTHCIPPPCDTVNVSLSNNVRPILDLYCGGCHIGKNYQGGVDLTSYDKIRVFVDDGSLSGCLNHISPFSPMPKNDTKMPSCQIAIIDKWIALGAPNN